jgi:PST family polysaccharide transporter
VSSGPETKDGQSSAVRRANLREATLRGLPWYAGARAVSELAALASSVAIARLLTPAEIGRAVLALICAGIAVSVFGEGFTTPLTQRRDVSGRIYESAAFASVVMGVLLTIVAATGGAALAATLLDDAAAEYVRLAAPLFALAALGVVPRVRLQRALAFPQLGAIDTSTVVVSLAVTVLLAALGWDGRSLIAGPLIAGALALVVLHITAGGALPRLHRDELVELRRFGVPAALSSLLYTGYRNVDYAIIGALLNPREVGIYYRAYTLGYEYQGKVSGIMLRLALPIYSRAENAEHMRSIRTRVVRAHATALFPLLALLAVVAPTFIPWFYGDQWNAAVVPAQILAIAGMAAAVLSGTGPLIFALGRADAMLRWNILTLLCYAAIIAATAPLGLVAVCIGVVAFQLANFVGASLVLAQGIAGIPFRQSLAEIAPAAISSAALAPIAWGVHSAASALELPTFLTLAVTAFAGGLTYAALLRRRFPSAFEDLRTVLRSVVPWPARFRRRGTKHAGERVTGADG